MEDRNTDIRMLEINVKETIRKLEIFQTDGRNGKIKNYNANYGEYVITVLEYLNSVVNILNSCSETTIARINSVIRKANKIMDKFYDPNKENTKKKVTNHQSDNQEKYFLINIKDRIEPVKHEGVDEDDWCYSYWKNERVRDCTVEIEEYKEEGFFFTREVLSFRKTFGIYAVDKGNGLHELMTGKPLKKWSESDYWPDSYIYYDTIEPISKEMVANNLEEVLNNKDRMNIYEGKVLNKVYSYKSQYREKLRKKEEEAKAFQEQKQKTLRNVQKLDSFRNNK